MDKVILSGSIKITLHYQTNNVFQATDSFQPVSSIRIIDWLVLFCFSASMGPVRFDRFLNIKICSFCFLFRVSFCSFCTCLQHQRLLVLSLIQQQRLFTLFLIQRLILLLCVVFQHPRLFSVVLCSVVPMPVRCVDIN